MQNTKDKHYAILDEKPDKKKEQTPDNPVEYVIVRKDLCEKYGYPAMMVQGAHASMVPLSTQLREGGYKIDDPETQRWISDKFTKIFLEVRDKEELDALIRRMDERGIDYFQINEQNLGGELTSIGLKPYERNKLKGILGHLRTLRDEEPKVYIGNSIIDSPKIVYSQRDLESELTFGEQITLDIDANLFLKGVSAPYQRFLDFIKKREIGTGNEYIDEIGPEIKNVKRNDFRFNQYLIESHFDTLLNPFVDLTKKGSNSVEIVSLDNIFYVPNRVLISGKTIR